ncbi:MAG: prepilin-type N-terminal cleavage/methylation domain-containing protein [Nitrospirota bacterium]
MPKRNVFSGGFTLIEVLIASSILVIVLGSFYQFLSFIYHNYEGQLAIAESDQELRVAVSLFQNEIQNAGLDPIGTAFSGPRTKDTVPTKCVKIEQPAQPIMEASETVFHFMGDINGGSTFNQENDRNEEVRYEWVGKSGRAVCDRKKSKRRDEDTLYRDTGGGLQPVSSGISYFNLDYFDENGQQLEGVGADPFLDPTNRNGIVKVLLTMRTSNNKRPDKMGQEWRSVIYLKNRG